MHRNFNDLEFELVGKLCVIVCGFAQVLSGSARGGQGGHLPPKILCCHPSLPPTLSEIKKNGHFPVQSGQNWWLFEGLAPTWKISCPPFSPKSFDAGGWRWLPLQVLSLVDDSQGMIVLRFGSVGGLWLDGKIHTHF